MQASSLYGLVGHKIGYSLSPYLHSCAARHLGLSLDYRLYDIAPSQLEQFILSFFAQGGRGLNVTQPYKQQVAKLFAQKQPAVNTLLLSKHQKIVAHNSDGPGFLQILSHVGLSLKGIKRFVFLGAGGATLAILSTLAAKGWSGEVWVLSRRYHSQQVLTLQALRVTCGALTPINLQKVLQPSQDTCCVQATSAPLQGQDLSEFLPSFSGFAGALIDLVYGTPSALYYDAKKKGRPCCDGLVLLIEQARISQQWWWGQSADFKFLYNKLVTMTNNKK